MAIVSKGDRSGRCTGNDQPDSEKCRQCPERVTGVRGDEPWQRLSVAARTDTQRHTSTIRIICTRGSRRRGLIVTDRPSSAIRTISPTDTPETLDYEFLAGVTRLLVHAMLSNLKIGGSHECNKELGRRRSETCKETGGPADDEEFPDDHGVDARPGRHPWCATASLTTTGWVPLFDGKTLDGWKVNGGTASYKVEDGVIVGTTVEGSPNTFLCKGDYKDFVLELDVKCDPRLNSGVQVRSHVYEKDDADPANRKRAGVVYGPQCEIARKETGTAGRFYDEGRRGKWLAEIKPEAKDAFRDDGWNRYRIVVQGNRYRSWVNGIAASDFTDDVDKGGFIGLQVHGIAKDQGPYQVRWRDIRIQELKPGEEVSSAEPPEGFKAVFNGHDLSGWEGNPTFWSVEDGCLTGKADGTLKFNRFLTWRGGTVRNFELRVKVKVSPTGNSGLQYRGTERPDLGESVVTGYQCDVVANRPDYNGMLYEERGRRILAHTGEKVVIDPKGQPWVVGQFPLKAFSARRMARLPGLGRREPSPALDRRPHDGGRH